jgi:hypothetical protein
MKLKRREFLAAVAAAIAAPAIRPEIVLKPGDVIQVFIKPYAGGPIETAPEWFPPPPFDPESIRLLMAAHRRQLARHAAEQAAAIEAGRRHDAGINRVRRIELGLPPLAEITTTL